MSVVNQMLKDLEKNQQSNTLNFDGNELNKPISSKSKDRSITIKVLLLIVVLFAVASGYLLNFYLSNQPRSSEVLASGSIVKSDNNAGALIEPTTHLDSERTVIEQDVVKKDRVNSSNTRYVENKPVDGSAIHINTASDTMSEGLKKSAEIEFQEPIKQQPLVEEQKTTSIPNVSIVNDKLKQQKESVHKEQKADNSLFSKSTSVGESDKTVTNTRPKSTIKSVSNEEKTRQVFVEAQKLVTGGDLVSANIKLNSLLSSQPNYHKARELLVYSLGRLNEVSKSDQILRQAIVQFPSFTNYWLLLAKSYLAQSRFNDVELLSSLSGWPSDNRSMLLMTAVSHQRQNNHLKAVEIYSKLLRLTPDRGDWWLGLSVSLESLKRNKDAFESLKKAKSDPRLTRVQKNFIEQKLNTLKGTF